MKKPLTQERVKSLLHYDPESGDFTWLRTGAFAGYLSGRYWMIWIDRQHWLLHTVAWLYVYGELVTGLDHIDRNGFNNAITNLRRATQSQNLMNRVPGRGWEKHGRKYRVRLKMDGQKIELGKFDTPEEARNAYLKGRLRYFGEYACR